MDRVERDTNLVDAGISIRPPQLLSDSFLMNAQVNERMNGVIHKRLAITHFRSILI